MPIIKCLLEFLSKKRRNFRKPFEKSAGEFSRNLHHPNFSPQFSPGKMGGATFSLFSAGRSLFFLLLGPPLYRKTIRRLPPKKMHRGRKGFCVRQPRPRAWPGRSGRRPTDRQAAPLTPPFFPLPFLVLLLLPARKRPLPLLFLLFPPPPPKGFRPRARLEKICVRVGRQFFWKDVFFFSLLFFFIRFCVFLRVPKLGSFFGVRVKCESSISAFYEVQGVLTFL